MAGVLALAVTKTGPFSWETPARSENEGFLETLLAERYTLGLVRLGLMALALFIVLSVPALIVAGRWLKGFSKEGLTADDAADASEAMADLQRQVRELTEERDRIAGLATEAQLRLAAARQFLEETLRMAGRQGPDQPTSGEGES